MEDIACLQSKVVRDGTLPPRDHHVLMARRDDVRRRCEAAFEEETSVPACAEPVWSEAYDVADTPTGQMRDDKHTYAWEQWEWCGNLPTRIGFVVGTPVRLRWNVNIADGLVNAASGVVAEIGPVHVEGYVEWLSIKFDNSIVGAAQRADTGSSFTYVHAMDRRIQGPRRRQR